MAISRTEIEKITDQYYTELYKFCAAKCGNADDAADIAQEVFLTFARKAPALENTKIYSWLLKTASIEVKEHFRSKGKTEPFPPDDEIFLKSDMPSVADPFDPQPLSEEDFELLLTKTQKKILDILDEDEKRLFIKRYMEKKSVCVISDELSVTPNYVYVKSHRIKKKAEKVISTLDLLISVWIFKCF